MTADTILIGFATELALLFRDDYQFSLDRLMSIGPELIVTMALALIGLIVVGVDRAVWRYTSSEDYLRILAVVGVAIIGATALGFLRNRLDGVPRSLPVLQFIVISMVLGAIRLGAKWRHTTRVRRTTLPIPDAATTAPHQAILVVGLNVLTDLFLTSVEEFASRDVRIVGLLGRQARHTGRIVRGYQVLGAPEDVIAVLRDLDVHGVVVQRIVLAVPLDSLPSEAQQALADIARTTRIKIETIAQRLGLDGWSIPAEHDPSASTTSRPASAPAPVVETPAPDTQASPVSLSDAECEAIVKRPFWSVKRSIDVVVGFVLLLAVLPLIALIAVVVACDLGVPTVFWQQRPGRGGRPFRLYKFRTMRSAHDGDGHRLADAERSSFIGRALRRFRLDALPQLYNIIVGDMSFVGPRPLLPIDQPADATARLMIRPGLTGWAQVNGGRVISMHDKAALDVWYLRHASFLLDIRIVLRTAAMLMSGERRDENAIRIAYSELQGTRDVAQCL